MNYLIVAVAALVGGYIAAIYTWPVVLKWINGATAEAQRLRQKAADLESAAKKVVGK